MESTESRLIIVSNRLPIAVSKKESGQMQIEPGSGGLVTAMAPVLKNRGGIWIGWSGMVAEEAGDMESALSEETDNFGYDLHAVNLARQEKENYYEGFANEVIWPLFHDFAAFCIFDPEYWAAYKKVNMKFAEEIKRRQRKKDFIWVHDYHLMMAAKYLNELEVDSQTAFFLHIPFPPLDTFLKLPWRFQILNALLEYDLLGFQTLRDRRNFIQCVRRLIPGFRREGRGQVISIQVNQRKIRVGAFPISIDFKDFAEETASQAVADKAWYFHEDFPNQQLILGVDRLDYTKGIIQRLNAFRLALKRFPELQEKTTLFQVVVPSRRTIPQYADLKVEIERLVGEINGEFTRAGWVPIHYLYRSLDRVELLALYRTSEMALITPLKDGMNLVAKEYCTCCLEENGVLILSEFAGAAAEFQDHALLVNPYDIEGIAATIRQAFMMERSERHSRMRSLRKTVQKHTIFWWVDSFLKAAFAKHLNDFPLLSDYMPQESAEISEEES